MRGRLLSLAALSGIYVLALGSVAPADVAAGVVVAVIARAIALRAPDGARGRGLRSLPALVPFVASVAVDVARGTWQTALVVLGLAPSDRAGIVDIPIGERTEVGTVVAALTSTLSPGEVLVDVDLERGVYVIHALDARDPDVLREHHRRGYERYQRRAIP